MQPISEKLAVGEPLSTEQLLEYLPALAEVPKTQLEKWGSGAAVLRRFKPGEIVCDEGAFGSTAFYLVSGRVKIYIANQLAHVKTRPEGTGLFARMKSFLVSDHDEKRDRRERSFIPIDASIDLSVSKPLGELGPGELFGEMTCRTFQPRSATVEAAEECVMIEMLRVILDMLVGTRAIDAATKSATRVKAPTFKGTSFKEELDRKYRERSLVNHLRSVPLFATLDAAFMAHLQENVELLSFGKDEVICKQDDPADAFFLIRQGMVKVSQNLPGGEMVRTYLGRGDYFGEIGLLHSQARNATCTALDSVDVVKITSSDFNVMLENFADVREQITEVAGKRLESDDSRRLPIGLNLDEFLNQGLFEAQNLLLIDLDRCTRCDLCVKACADAHEGITRLLRDGLRYDKYLVATTCRTCRDPLCMTQCPVGSIRRKDTLEIIIEDWCIGCSKCAELCPYGNINMHPVAITDDASLIDRLKRLVPSNDAAAEKKPASANKAATCDLCTEHSVPSCVYACPHDAAKRVDPADYFTRLRRSRSPELIPWQRSRFDRKTTHREEETE